MTPLSAELDSSGAIPSMSRATVEQALTRAQLTFENAGIETPRLDAQLLLAFALGVRREDLAREPEQDLTERATLIFDMAVKLRSQRRPLPYITGEKYFYGRAFKVNRAVLIPRPETELLIDFALKVHRSQSPSATFRVADIGTGSGCIAVTVACEVPEAHVFATDISRLALLVTAKNVKRQGVSNRVQLLEGNLMDPVTGEKFDLILSNPPYIPDSEIAALMPEVRDFEPRLALSGNDESISGQSPESIRQALMRQSVECLNQRGWLALEVGLGQADDAATEMINFGYSSVEVISDHAKIGRLVVGCLA